MSSKNSLSAVDRFKLIVSQPKFQGWKRTSEFVTVFEIPYFGSVVRYTLETGNGTEVYFSLLRSFGWSVVFGVTADRELISLAQYKPGVDCGSWELSPGGIGIINPGTSDEEILRKTQMIYLRETGYGNGSWSYLGNTMIETGKYRGPRITDHGLPAHMFLAMDLVKIQKARNPNPDEIMETLMVPLREMREVMESKLFKETSAHSCAFEALLKLGMLKWNE
ncbi:MAG TPA: hypothetical protein VMD74_04325 [Candidatus Methylomirabilis sp.]|nr:hypothetical protein [Candidatus Methylomirabilis sp.]